ncbi:MAG TPA: tRNA uridine(34) 5-carboxymethylaminomethyl modification radical SAM/GNAT enzyme Elp3 [Anaerolineae bacterium]|nr:tRNA uridine(34) 5-carboxymethylaminomethyl modification radical SAM/GNAT enzyme Elp3 [Anaerolineae bacterium]
MGRDKAWLKARAYTPEQLALARRILEEVQAGSKVADAVRRNPLPEGGYLGKHALIFAYRQLTDCGEWDLDPEMMKRLRMKPMRTLSGVTTVTVLTEPHPCPGTCIFCPDLEHMPKSYLPDEPGAMRGLHHGFDPFEQTAARIEALQAIGHPTDKIELLILGGTWSVYPHAYQERFVQRCLDAMNGFDSDSLAEAQAANERAEHKNVGMVIETRPDCIDREELARLRRLGVTKVQMGAQSFDDRILELNRRGHSADDTRRAVALLRAAGIKIVLHWMPNLLGATLQSDAEDFAHLWDERGPRPDEIKIYPCQLLENTELHAIWQRGEYVPYTTEQLIDLIAGIKPGIPRYCRVNRVVRDIPSTNVIEGNKRTSLRQDVQQELAQRGHSCACIRCREIRSEQVESEELELQEMTYPTGGALEHFVSYVTPEDRLAGYVRLSLPGPESPDPGLKDLETAALIRELHVYGQSLPLGESEEGAAQHTGLGMQLMARAEALAREQGYSRLAVIAALGTRGYYRRLGYELGDSYMCKAL